MPGSFLDSNILIYFAMKDEARFARADALIQKGGTISVQVLNEFANVARNRMKLDWERVTLTLTALRTLLTVEPMTTLTHDTGLDLARRYNLAIYDAMLAAAALIAECDTFWSEDMHHGLVIEERLTIRNPFVDS